MGYALPVHLAMTDLSCEACGINYAVPENWRSDKQRTGATGYCPNGHGWAYRETEAMKYRRLYEAEAARHTTALARANEAQAAQRQVEAELTRHKKRAKHGVCPCCKRTFKQLAAHMKTKHPDYK